VSIENKSIWYFTRQWGYGVALCFVVAAIIGVSSLYAAPIIIVAELMGYEIRENSWFFLSSLLFGPYYVAKLVPGFVRDVFPEKSR